jgi:hypothetical protein
VSFSLSPQMRVVALVGVIAVLGLGAGVFVLGHTRPASSPTPALSAQELIKRAHASHHVTARAKSVPAPVRKHSAAPSKKAAAKVRPAVKAEARPVVRPKPKVTLDRNLPNVLLSALRSNDIVIAAMFNPKARDDQIAVAEAQAGAHDAGVGFVGLNVLDQGDVALITRTYGIVGDPAVLVFRRPGVVIARLNGFADRVTVAQAVEDNAPGATKVVSHPAPAAAPAVAPTAWLQRATAICKSSVARLPKDLAALSTSQLVAIWSSQHAALAKLAVPKAKASAFAEFIRDDGAALALARSGAPQAQQQAARMKDDADAAKVKVGICTSFVVMQ